MTDWELVALPENLKVALQDLFPAGGGAKAKD
mgnify:CR=1 FL=1